MLTPPFLTSVSPFCELYFLCIFPACIRTNPRRIVVFGMTCFAIDRRYETNISTQLRYPGDRLAHQLKECCPRRSKRFALLKYRVVSFFNPLSLEYGHADVNIINVNSHVNRLFAGLGDTMPVFMSHFDKLVSLPEVREIRFCFIFSLIDSNRASWSLVPPRTQSTPVLHMRRSTSLVGLPKPRLRPCKKIC